MTVHEGAAPTQPTNRTRLQSLLVVVLLLIGVVGVYAPQIGERGNEARGASLEASRSYIADLDFWQRTKQETTAFTDVAFDLAHDLAQVPLTVGDWHGVDVPETNLEVQILLEPEQYVQRLYQNSAGHYVWLSMIGGRSSQSFHPPDICYDADGWQFSMNSHAFALNGGGSIHALWLEAEKPAADHAALYEHIVSYFYLFPNAERRLTDGIVLFKLTSERYGSAQETLALHEDFVRHLFTSAQ